MQQPGGSGEERNRAGLPGLQEPPCLQHQHHEGRGFFSQPVLRVQRDRSLMDGSQVYLRGKFKLSILWVKNCLDPNKGLGLGGILPSLSNGKAPLCVFLQGRLGEWDRSTSTTWSSASSSAPEAGQELCHCTRTPQSGIAESGQQPSSQHRGRRAASVPVG